MEKIKFGRGCGRSGNFTANVSSNNQGVAQEVVDGDRAYVPTLSDAQFNILMTTLNQHKLSSSTPKLHGKKFYDDQWIIDTGASNHMSGNIELFTHLHDIPSSPVGLPNGKVTNATKEGQIKLNEKLILENVLFVPALTCNLLSVSQLLEKQKFIILFTNKLCIIQDHTLRNLIGAGVQSNGVYLYQPIHSFQANKVSAADLTVLWHRRLGHPSSKVLLPLLGVDGSSKNCFDNCEVCYLAKQPRTSFPNSMNKANDLFDIIHCDIWGPYNTASSCGAHYFLTIVDNCSRAV